MSDTYDANIRVRELARSVDDNLNALASRQQRPKWEVVRAALEEYVENHKGELC